MFAYEIVREIKLDNCLEFGEIDMSDVFEVVRLKYPMLVMSFLDGIRISQNLCTGDDLKKGRTYDTITI